MRTILSLILLLSIETIGLQIASMDEMLLHRPRVWVNAMASRLLGRHKDLLLMPLIECATCMPSLHGALLCTAWHLYKHLPFTRWSVALWVAVALGGVVLNNLLFPLIQYLWSLNAPAPPREIVVRPYKPKRRIR